MRATGMAAETQIGLSPIPHDDRRACPRFAVDEQASVQVVGHGMSFTGRILNLGLHGCRLQSGAHLPGGGRVRVEVTFSVNGIPFRMGGAVRWSDEDDMGIQFVRVSMTRHSEWTRVIEELKAQTEKDAAAAVARNRLPQRDTELVQIVDRNLAEAARLAGPLLACRIGCTQCCHGAFAINALDAMRLRTGMEKMHAFAPETAAAVEARARAWVAEFGADFPGDAATGVLGTSDADRERFEDFANDAPCPALNPETGKCDVYAWRPMTCRVFGPPVRAAGEEGQEGLGHCELCFVGASEEAIAGCEMPVPHDLEAELLEHIGETGETVVAFALLP
jgi:Fe-S-cluster containining protein